MPLSTNDPRPHCGLGRATTVDAIEVHWPSGLVEQVSLPSVDRMYAIEEGKGIVSSVYDSMIWNHGPQVALAGQMKPEMKTAK